MTQPQILVVDDDVRLRRLIKKYLTEQGLDVYEAGNAAEAQSLLALFVFDLMIMDVMMPGQNGQDFTKALRAQGEQTPILMLTAMGDIDNRVKGLEAGADDYLPKPFEPKELLLRVQSILKRTGLQKLDADIRFGDCVFQPARNILLKSGKAVALTTAELALLRALLSKANQALSRSDLGKILNADNVRAIDVQITRLRRKVEEDIKNPMCIQTMRGQGYRLVTQ
ncbi:MAG: response regulator [Alphaproteobacteria bacterium]|nr:response regulator [Alphaproteobacteria bacterium]